MRRTTIGMLAVTALAVSGCGSGSTFANKPRPASPVNLTVYINDSQVSVSPASVGAGEVVFVVTNQASSAQSLTIHQSGDGHQIANTGPINPQSTAQVTVDFKQPGTYTMASRGGNSGSDAANATSRPSITPASLHIGPKRPNSSSALLQP